MNIFEIMYDKFTFNKKTITLFEAFAGIGSQAIALKQLSKEFDFELDTIGISEIDKYAIAAYNEIHGETKNYGSICDIQEIPQVDIFTYSFPCQDISLAGNRKGFSRDSNTRSGLLWEVERLLENQEKIDKLPQVLLMENVKALVGLKFKDDYIEWQLKLEELGYKNYWQVLNAKHYGIPQNRERVFMVSILGEYHYTFPDNFPLKLRLKDMLENNVDEKYYLSDKAIAKTQRNRMGGNYIDKTEPTIGTIIAGYYKIPGDGIYLKETNKIIYEEPLLRKGWHNKACEVLNTEGITTCIHTQSNNLLQKVKEPNNLRIRKLTPKECYRLMGFSDDEFAKAESVISNSQLYKTAGNSIVVDVLYYIFKNLFIGG